MHISTTLCAEHSTILARTRGCSYICTSAKGDISGKYIVFLCLVHAKCCLLCSSAFTLLSLPVSLGQNVLPQLRRYDTSQPTLALDVKAYLTSSAAAASMLTNKNKADRKSLVEMITNYQLMAGLIRLFEIDPILAFAAPPQVCITLSMYSSMQVYLLHKYHTSSKL